MHFVYIHKAYIYMQYRLLNICNVHYIIENATCYNTSHMVQQQYEKSTRDISDFVYARLIRLNHLKSTTHVWVYITFHLVQFQEFINKQI